MKPMCKLLLTSQFVRIHNKISMTVTSQQAKEAKEKHPNSLATSLPCDERKSQMKG